MANSYKELKAANYGVLDYLSSKDLLEGYPNWMVSITFKRSDEVEIFMESSYAEKEAHILRKIYEMGGVYHTGWVDIQALVRGLGMAYGEVNEVLIDLENRKGLIEGIEEAVKMAPAGIEIVEARAGGRFSAPNITYHTTIHGPNYGGIQQGGQGNTQNVSIQINQRFETKLQELLLLVEASTALTHVQRLKGANDIRAIQELSRIESTPEVIEEVRSRTGAVESIISLSADLTSIGMPIIQIIRAFFGI